MLRYPAHATFTPNAILSVKTVGDSPETETVSLHEISSSV